MNTLEDRSVHDKNQWDSALKFMEATVKDKLELSKLFDQVIFSIIFLATFQQSYFMPDVKIQGSSDVIHIHF